MSEKMREILFRGKRTDNGAWVEGAFCLKDCDDIFGDIVDRPSIIKYDPPYDGFWFQVHPETVGQFIGLADKNGKKIFEGDIIETKGCRWAIGFANTAFAAMDGPNMQFAMFEQYIWDHKKREWEAPSYWEVVGNIHDNPELLEEISNV